MGGTPDFPSEPLRNVAPCSSPQVGQLNPFRPSSWLSSETAAEKAAAKMSSRVSTP